MYAWALGTAALILLWALYITRHGGEVDGHGMYGRFHRGWRRLAFWAGDVYRLRSFPYLSWSKNEHRVTEEEWMDAIALVRPGDVMLSTHEDAIVSNTAIPGCFKHAGLISDGPEITRLANGEAVDIRAAKLVEAVSEGVQKWHPMRARADRMILLRPLAVTEADTIRAVKTANKIVGCDYDAGFKFNIEDELSELKRISKIDATRAIDDERELKVAATNVCAEYDMAFSCTETVATAWWHRRRELRIFRRRSRGRDIIVADQFVNNGFKAVWTNVTVEEAREAGLEEEGIDVIKQYWESKIRIVTNAGSKPDPKEE